MNSVSIATNGSARRRAQRAARDSLSLTRTGGGKSAVGLRGMGPVNTERDLTPQITRPHAEDPQAMHAYRTHTCGQLRASDAGETARLSGWIHSKRDHGGLLFIDLRDHYGLTQCVLPAGSAAFATADELRQESVITVTGRVVRRSKETTTPRLPTGEVEVQVDELIAQSAADVLPIQVAGEHAY